MKQCPCMGGGKKTCLCSGTGYLTDVVAADPVAELLRLARLPKPGQLTLGGDGVA